MVAGARSSNLRRGSAITGDPLFRCDEQQRIVDWNAAAARLTGISRTEALGRRCWDVVAGRDQEGRPVCRPGCPIARLASHGWPVECTDLTISTPSGPQRVSISTIVVRGAEPLVLHPIRVAPERAAVAHGAPRLTPRQREILELLAGGSRVKEIALHLQLSQTTVRNHIRGVLVELGAHSQLEAVAKARAFALVA